MISMKQVFDQFVSNDTSMKQSEIPIEEYPTITICVKSEYVWSYQDDFTISWGGVKLTLGTEKEMQDEYDISVNEIPDYDEEIPSKIMFQKVFSYMKGQSCYKIKEIAKKKIKGYYIKIFLVESTFFISRRQKQYFVFTTCTQ